MLNMLPQIASEFFNQKWNKKGTDQKKYVQNKQRWYHKNVQRITSPYM